MHPKIPGITWLNEEIPDLISVPIILEDSSFQKLGLTKGEPATIETVQYFDLSKLAGVRLSFPTEMDTPSETSCFIDIEGMNSFIAEVKPKALLAAWTYYKQWRYSKNGK